MTISEQEQAPPDTRCRVCELPEEKQIKCAKCGGECACPKHGCPYCDKVDVIAKATFDDGEYLGSSREGVGGIYFLAAEGPLGGWYVSLSYDWGHDCGDLYEDDGPFPTEADAWMAGLHGAADVLSEQGISGWRTEYRRLHREYSRMKRRREQEEKTVRHLRALAQTGKVGKKR